METYSEIPFRFIFEHAIDKKDTLIIPSRYSWSNIEQEDFVTYNYASDITLYTGNKMIKSFSVTKLIFNDLLGGDLSEYGVLLYPNFRGYNQDKKVIQLQYSISIPLTDIGKSVLLEIKLDGSTSVLAD
jgi:hypothetical protein